MLDIGAEIGWRPPLLAPPAPWTGLREGWDAAPDRVGDRPAAGPCHGRGCRPFKGAHPAAGTEGGRGCGNLPVGGALRSELEAAGTEDGRGRGNGQCARDGSSVLPSPQPAHPTLRQGARRAPGRRGAGAPSARHSPSSSLHPPSRVWPGTGFRDARRAVHAHALAPGRRGAVLPGRPPPALISGPRFTRGKGGHTLYSGPRPAPVRACPSSRSPASGKRASARGLPCASRRAYARTAT